MKQAAQVEIHETSNGREQFSENRQHQTSSTGTYLVGECIRGTGAVIGVYDRRRRRMRP